MTSHQFGRWNQVLTVNESVHHKRSGSYIIAEHSRKGQNYFGTYLFNVESMLVCN